MWAQTTSGWKPSFFRAWAARATSWPFSTPSSKFRRYRCVDEEGARLGTHSILRTRGSSGRFGFEKKTT